MAVNGESVVFMEPKEVKAKLKSASRPMTVRFVRQCSESHFSTATTPSGQKRVKKWIDGDVPSRVRLHA